MLHAHIFHLLFGIYFHSTLQHAAPGYKAEDRWKTHVFPDHLIDKAKALDEQFGPSKWEYNVQCRLRFQQASQQKNKGQCLVDGIRKPVSCFQEPILYNYTWNSEVPSFPHQLAVVQRFPKCWSKLGPLLCGTLYRPCVLKKMFRYFAREVKEVSSSGVNSSTVPTQKTSTDELWQVFYPDFCHNAAKDCSFLEELQLWPSFLRCNDQVATQLIPSVPETAQPRDFKLFNPNCKVAYVQSPSQPKRYQCLWPLVHIKPGFDISTQPLMDECHMPCRSPLLSSQASFDFFHCFAAVMSIVLFGIYIYLAWLSQIYIDHLEVFLVANALLSLAVYFLVLFCPWFGSFFETAICAKGGIIRNELGRIGFGSSKGLQNLFHLCTLEGGILLFSSISCSAWTVVPPVCIGAGLCLQSFLGLRKEVRTKSIQ